MMLLNKRCPLITAYVTAWRSVGKYIFFSPELQPNKEPKDEDNYKS
jgi:hypothetical protein